MHLYALHPVILTHSHTYKEKICSRCLMIIWVAWGSQYGAVLVGLPLEVSWRVCGAQIRLIDAHLLRSINRYESATYLQSSVCDCVHCILLALLYVLRKTPPHSNIHTQTHTHSPWLRWNDFQMKMTRQELVDFSFLITRSFHVLLNFVFSSHHSCVLHCSQVISFYITLFLWLLYFISVQDTFNLHILKGLTHTYEKSISVHYVQTNNLQMADLSLHAVRYVWYSKQPQHQCVWWTVSNWSAEYLTAFWDKKRGILYFM